MRIALDAMGGDYAPAEIVKGAILAADGLDGIEQIILVGDEAVVRSHLQDSPHLASGRITIHHASEAVGMDEKPAQAVRRKKDSSIGRAVELVRDGRADAMVSAGNTGAVVVAATLRLRNIENVIRPAIAVVMPTRGRPVVLIDAGANVECDSEVLVQFAAMGTVYSRVVLQCEQPVVGLLSIGGEDIKGNDTTRLTHAGLSRSALNFRGNVEGHDLFVGETDVVVCDGFVGNVVLKTTESVAHAIGHWIKEEFKRNPVRILGALMLKGALKALKAKMDPERYGGALLLGVNGVCIITHGASSRHAIFHAIRVAGELVQHRMSDLIKEELRKLEEAP